MPAAPRTLIVTYGAFVVSLATGRQIDDLVSYGDEQDVGFFEFSFVIRKPTLGAFLTERGLVEQAFRKPRQRLRVEFEGSDFKDLNPDDTVNTGFNHRPIITKRQEMADGPRSLRYFVRVDYDLPADVHDEDGRQDSRVDVSFTASRKRTLTVTGTYTALTTEGSARIQYETNIGDYLVDLILEIGGPFEVVSESQEADETDKLLDFRIELREIIDDQSASGAPDDSEIVDATLTISRLKPGPGDSPIARRLAEIVVNYSASVIKGVDLESKYENSLRDFLINKALGIFGVGQAALVAEQPEFDTAESRITVSMTLLAPVGNTARIEFTQTTEINDEFGVVIVPAWTGNAFAAHTFQGFRKKIRTVTNKERILNAAPAPGGAVIGGAGGAAAAAAALGFGGGAGGGGVILGGGQGAAGLAAALGFGGGQAVQGALPPAAGGGGGDDCNFIGISRRVSETPIRLGSPSHFLDVLDKTTITLEQCVAPVAATFAPPLPVASGD